jgi:hypothetical protein
MKTFEAKLKKARLGKVRRNAFIPPLRSPRAVPDSNWSLARREQRPPTTIAGGVNIYF